MRENVGPKITCKVPLYVPREKITVKHHGGMWDTSKKTGKSETKILKSVLSKLFKLR